MKKMKRNEKKDTITIHLQSGAVGGLENVHVIHSTCQISFDYQNKYTCLISLVFVYVSYYIVVYLRFPPFFCVYVWILIISVATNVHIEQVRYNSQWSFRETKRGYREGRGRERGGEGRREEGGGNGEVKILLLSPIERIQLGKVILVLQKKSLLHPYALYQKILKT